MHGQKKGNPLERVARNKKTGRFQKLRKNNMPASKASKIKDIKRTVQKKASKPSGSFVDDEMLDKTSAEDKRQIQARKRRQQVKG